MVEKRCSSLKPIRLGGLVLQFVNVPAANFLEEEIHLIKFGDVCLSSGILLNMWVNIMFKIFHVCIVYTCETNYSGKIKTLNVFMHHLPNRKCVRNHSEGNLATIMIYTYTTVNIKSISVSKLWRSLSPRNCEEENNLIMWVAFRAIM